MKVFQKIQSTLPESTGLLPPPVDFQFYSGDDKVAAIAALVSAAADSHNRFYRVLDVRLEL